MLLYDRIYKTCCEKEITCSTSITFYLFFTTRLFNLIKHEHPYKVLYLIVFLMSERSICILYELSIEENGYSWPSKESGKQLIVKKKSANFEMDIEW